MKLIIFQCLLWASFLQIIPSKASAQNDTSGVSGKDSLAFTQKNRPLKVYHTQRLDTKKPVIDGVLDDTCWSQGNWAGDFIQFIPSEGGIPSLATQVKILFDDKNIYVAIRSFDDEPEKTQKYAGMRDEFQGDMVGVTFDSYHDHRTGFEFDLTAYGQKVDLVLTNPMEIAPNWNPVWSGKVGTEQNAWVAEMEIPLSQLRYDNKDEQVWGLHVWRWIGRLAEENDWEYQSLTGPGVLYNFGELRGIDGLKKSRRFEIMPYARGDLSTFEKQPGNPFTESGKSWNGNAGLDMKVGLSSNFTMDLSINPDFGQVESDPSVMNLSAFETFYEEKRPFFLEGGNIFSYEFDDLNLFYSRRIGHSPSYQLPENDSLFTKANPNTTILNALKISGKTSDGLSLGILQSITSPEYSLTEDLQGNEGKIKTEPLSNFMIARVQKDYHSGETMIGGILTSVNRNINVPHLDFLSRNAFTGGLDALHYWKEKKYFVDARLVGSYIDGSNLSIKRLQESSARYFQRPGNGYLDYDTTASNISGSGGKLRIGKGSGLWRYNTGLNFKSPGLELNDIGYMQMSDQISQSSELKYFVVQPVSVFRSYSIGLREYNNWNFGGTYLGSGSRVSFMADFKNKWSFSLNFLAYSTSIDSRILRGGPDMKIPGSVNGLAYLGSDHSKKLNAGIHYEVTHRSMGSADMYSLGGNISIRPFNTLKIDVSTDYNRNKDELQFVTSIPETTGTRYILGKIDQKTLSFTLRVDYSLSPEFSFQYYGSPFVSRGLYSEFKELTNPTAENYYDRYENYTGPVNNPDFNFHEFRSNLVLKWEYRPGSFLYAVWSDSRNGLTDPAESSVSRSMKQIWDLKPGNIFLIKFSYWFSI
ncbi:MAG: carbohydrate binding family 9 domain-containing protein [Bacteroidales bacterium]|nr:carbohydrate binding family 9 domain-containing protein [Bacteroidales bacterium]MCB9013201.1 carbohydrate binding family 9 domain-containing protein [Bacteroidales bacterium]